MLERRSSGFTLIELVTVLAIASIMLMIGAPLLTQWQANSQVRSVAEALQNDLRRAQNEAVRRNRQVAFLLTNGTPTKDNPVFAAALNARNWAIVALPLLLSGEGANQQPKDAGGNDIPGDPVTGVILSHSQNANSTATITGDVTAVCFNSIGRLVASSAPIANAGGENCVAMPAGTTQYVFQVQSASPSANRRINVQIGLGGQIRMCDPDRSITTHPDGC